MSTPPSGAWGNPPTGPYGQPAPGYGPPNYPAPGYQGQPPGYQGYPPGYPGQPPGYPGYPPPGYGQPVRPQPDVKPGVIPLRPLSLSDLYNGAVAYIRANPAATLGLTAIVVVASQLINLLLTLGPLAVLKEAASDPTEVLVGYLGLSLPAQIVGGVVTWAATTVLVGMLTVVIGRAVFGSPITVGEAWALVKGRIWALLGLGALLGGAGLLILLVAGLLVFGAYAAAGAVAALLIGVLLFLLLVPAYLYVSTVLAFASTAIVLERMSVFDAIRRSFNLVRNDFWRVLGILLLTSLVVAFVAGAVGAPFAIIGSVVQAAVSSVGGLALSTVISHVGSAIGLIITQPFVAGVTVLLYTDRRIRAEAFDLVLRTGAASGPAAVASTDSLWLTRSA